MTGVVARKIEDKGFGFVRGEDDKEYFFHMSSCSDSSFESIREGDRVEFTPSKSHKGLRAEDVTKA